DREAEQPRRAGIPAVLPPDLAWAARDPAPFGLPERVLLLVPGGSAHRPQKRWPIENYAALAVLAARRRLTPVILGGAQEVPLAAVILERCSTARDLTGHTAFGDIVGLGKIAERAIGNDTGPMHLLAASGCPATVLFSAASDPDLTAPRGPNVVILRRADLAGLTVEEVAATLRLG